MEEQEIKKMLDIDQKAQLGQKITKEEKDFFNRKYFLMLKEMRSNYNHWMHHTHSL